MPTIRVTTSYQEFVYDADRVVRDSRVLVVEKRRERAWRRVGATCRRVGATCRTEAVTVDVARAALTVEDRRDDLETAHDACRRARRAPNRRS